MLDDWLGDIFGEVVAGRLSNSRRAQLLFRVFFGLLGGGLGLVGAIHFGSQADLTHNTALRACMVAMFLFLACFSLFNVAFARKWRWPGRWFVVSFIGIFATRILFGP